MHIKVQTKNIYILFILFLFISIFVIDYIMLNKIGYFLLLLELMILVLCIINSGSIERHFSWKRNIFLVLALYQIVFSYIENTNNINLSINTIYYRELGMILAVSACVIRIEKRKIIFFLRNIGIILSIVGCYEYFSKTSLFYQYILNKDKMYGIVSLGTSNARVRTIFIHPIICAVYTTIFWLILLYFPLKNKWMDMFAKIVILVCLIGTQSRSSWISFFLVTLLYIWDTKKIGIVIKKKDLIRWGIIVFSTLIFILFSSDKLIETINWVWRRFAEGLDSKNVSNFQRVIMIHNGIQEWNSWGIWNKLVGQGSGYAYLYLRRHPIFGWTRAVDNQYLTLLMDSGLIGCGLYLAIVVGSFYDFVCAKDKINKICNLVIISVFISSFFYEMLGWEICTVVFCLFISIGNDNKGHANEK